VRAVRASGDGGVAVVQVEATAPDHALDPVRVRVRSCGICSSDLHLAAWNLPVTLGHEFAGVLDDGTAVAVQPNVWCGECDRCRAGETQLCRTGLSRMHGVSVDGGLADEVIVDRSCLVPLPPGVAPEIGALVEPLAVAGHALGRVPLQPGTRILVIGGGSIGLSIVAAARRRDLEVDLSARYAHQHEAGERLGARRELAEEYEVVVDAAGTQSSFDEAIAHVRPAGNVVVAATYWDPVSFGSNLLGKEARIVPASMYGHDHGVREFETAAALLGARPEIADALVSHRFGLDEAAEAFRVSGDRAAGAIKVVLGP
jgi:threonine dehydrogenase-like Zn-dependent dehydrogenase